MSTGINKIEAPNLNGSYGQNIKKTFDNIDANFGMLSNSDLYKGEPGSSLISMYVPWCVLLSDSEQSYGGYKFEGSRDAIIEAFNAIKDSEQPEDDQDITAAIEQLTGNGDPGDQDNPQVFISFVEPASQDESVVIESITPYIFIDERFRTNLSQNIEVLGDCVDMSCVITVNSNNRFVCTQNFPTLYFNKDEGDDQALYWIINGSKTMIRANGPKGLDGETGNFYIGLTPTEDLPENLSDDTLEDLDIRYILAPKRLTEDDKTKLDGYDDYLPFIPVDKYPEIMGTPIYEGAPIIVLLSDITSFLEDDTPEDIPYFISFITRKNDTDWVSPVSTYNQCFARITDTAVKYAIMNNVKILNSGETVSSDSKQIPCYPLRSTDQGSTAGYAIWAIKEGNTNKFIVAYVNDINAPSLIGSSQGSYVFSGSVAEGNNTTANGNYSHAEGKGSVDSFPGTIGSVSSGNGSIRVSLTDAAKIKVGQLIEITKSNINSVVRVINKESAGSSLYAVTFNYYSGDVLSGSAGESITIIIRTGISYGNYSHSEGKHTVAGGNGAHAEGAETNAEGDYSHAEGSVTVASGKGSHAEGYANNNGLIQTNGDGAHAEGFANNGSTISASGKGAHAEGFTEDGNVISASGKGAHAEGQSTTASGNYSHAEGSFTTAEGYASHTEGDHTAVPVSGDSAHAEGFSTTASGGGAHAEGSETTASGNYSHAEGNSTIASGNSSHAEGISTTASRDGSHAEGYNTKAKGATSHAEGYNTTASGPYSHAEGNGTTASGNYSHAEGWGTIADDHGAHACGKYNAGGYIYRGVAGGDYIYGINPNNINSIVVGGIVFENIGKRVVFSVGFGADDNHRCNSLWTDERGKVYIYNGNMSVEGYLGINNGGSVYKALN